MIENQPSTLSDSQTNARRLLVAFAWLVSFYLFCWHFLWVPFNSSGVDFGKHWIAADWVLKGLNPYEGELYLSFNYPLFVAFLYTPLDLFTLETAEHVFDIINFIYLLGSVALLTVMLRPTVTPDRLWIRDFWGPLIMFSFSQSNSLRQLMVSGNIDGLNVILLCTFITLLVKGYDRLAGVALGLVVLVKVAPILFLLPVFALRKWWCLGVAIGLIGFYWLILILTGWAECEVSLITKTLPNIAWFWHYISISIHNTIIKQFIGWENVTESDYKRFVFAVNAVIMMGLVTLVFLRWKHVKDSTPRIMIFSYQWLIIFIPLLEMIHVAWVLPALYVGSREWAERRFPTIIFLFWLFSFVILLHINVVGTHFSLISHNISSAHLLMTLIVLFSLFTVTLMTMFSPEENPTK